MFLFCVAGWEEGRRRKKSDVAVKYHLTLNFPTPKLLNFSTSPPINSYLKLLTPPLLNFSTP